MEIKKGQNGRKKRARDKDAGMSVVSDVFGPDLDDSDIVEQEEPSQNQPVGRSKRTKTANPAKRQKWS